MTLIRGIVIGVVALLVSAATAKAAYIPTNDGKFMWGEERQYPRYYHRDQTSHRYATKKKYKKKYAKRKKHRRTMDANGNKGMPWNMVRVKTVQGFYLTVHPAYAHKFLRFFEILAQNNVKVPREIVGCYARGHHVRGSNHYIGAACDIQTGWNKTIPEMYHASKWIKQAGLYDGCSFGDCGHVEAIRGTHNAKRVPNIYQAMAQFKSDESTANYQP